MNAQSDSLCALLFAFIRYTEPDINLESREDSDLRMVKDGAD